MVGIGLKNDLNGFWLSASVYSQLSSVPGMTSKLSKISTRVKCCFLVLSPGSFHSSHSLASTTSRHPPLPKYLCLAPELDGTQLKIVAYSWLAFSLAAMQTNELVRVDYKIAMKYIQILNIRAL